METATLPNHRRIARRKDQSLMHSSSNGDSSDGIPQAKTNGAGRLNGSTESSGDLTLVMGAGPGGLCSAYVLSKAGRPAVVVEKAPFVGGLARTIKKQTEHGEFKFDIGGHRWFTKNDELNQIFREVI